MLKVASSDCYCYKCGHIFIYQPNSKQFGFGGWHNIYCVISICYKATPFVVVIDALR